MNATSPTTFAALQDRIEYLEAENANLRTQLRLDQEGGAVAAARQAFGIEPGPSKVLLQLLDGRPHSRDSLFNALYINRLDQPDLKIIDAFIFKLRRALKPTGIEIQSIWSFEYQMKAEDCAKAKAVLAGARP
jgi:DNA-binding response OmpR family regulator